MLLHRQMDLLPCSWEHAVPASSLHVEVRAARFCQAAPDLHAVAPLRLCSQVTESTAAVVPCYTNRTTSQLQESLSVPHVSACIHVQPCHGACILLLSMDSGSGLQLVWLGRAPHCDHTWLSGVLHCAVPADCHPCLANRASYAMWHASSRVVEVASIMSKYTKPAALAATVIGEVEQ